MPLVKLDAVGPEHSQEFAPKTSFAPPGRKRIKGMDFFSSSAFHGLRVGPLRGPAAPPAATPRRPVGAHADSHGRIPRLALLARRDRRYPASECIGPGRIRRVCFQVTHRAEFQAADLAPPGGTSIAAIA